MRIIDNDHKGTNGGTLYEFNSGYQCRLCAMIAGEYDAEYHAEVNQILHDILTYEQAYQRWHASRKKT